MKTEKDFDFFSVAEIIKNVEKKSYRKLAFLSISFGIALSFGVTISSNWMKSHEENEQQEMKQNEAAIKNNQQIVKTEKEYALQQIKKITPEDFSNFLSYMHLELFLYDDKINLITNTADQAFIEGNAANQQVINSAKLGTEINNSLGSYKRNTETNIVMMQELYNKVINSNTQYLQSTDYDIFLKYYNNYQANVYTHNKTMDEVVNDKQYPDYYNQGYNTRHQIPQLIQEIDKKQVIALTSLKNKMK